MDNVTSLGEIGEFPLIVVNDRIVIKTNQSFTNMTEFKTEDFLNKKIEDVFMDLRVGPDISCDNINETIDYFLFTKSLEVKFVNIQVINGIQEKTYIFLEKPNSNISSRFGFADKLCSDNYYGIGIFSLPDITLLRANDTFASFFDAPYNKKENCIGRRVSEFVTGFAGSTSEKVWKDITITGQPFNIEEYMFDRFERGITYWRSTFTPIYEDGKPKYCIEMTTEITDQVLQRKKIEEQAKIIENQNKQLKWQADMLNFSSDAILAWELNGCITYWNTGAEHIYGYGREEAVGSISHDLLKTKFPNKLDDVKSTLLRDGIWKSEIIHTKKDGEQIAVETSMKLIPDEFGRQIVLETNRDITNRKKMERELEQQKDELEEIIQSIDDAIYIYDGNKNFYLVNNAGKELYKNVEFNTFDDVNNSGIYKYYDVNGNEITTENLTVSRVSRGETVVNYKMTFKNNTGTQHFSVNGRPVYDDKGNIKFVILCCRNITKDVEAQKLIEQQKEELEAIIDNISEELYIVDKERNYIKSNKAARERYSSFEFKNSREYVRRNKLYDLLGNEIDIDNTPIARLTKGECIKDEAIIVCDPDKRYLCINAKPIFDVHGNFKLGVMLTQDITARVLQEQKIKYQSEQLQAIIDSMSDGLELVDSKMKITFLNQSAKDFFYNPDAKVNAGDSLKYNKYYYGIDGKEIPLEDLPAVRVINKGNFQNYILTIDRPDKKIYVSINGSTINNDNGAVEEAILSIRDITEQVKKDIAVKYHQDAALNAEREKSEALEKAIEMKDEFLSLISHEFRTPLNVINTAIQAMNYICGNELPDKAKKYINTIRQNTFRQLRLVNNLLDITRADAGRIKIYKKNIDIVFLTNSIVESVYSYASQKGVMITFVSSIGKRIIGIDDEKYERILLNLLSNAIKFTPAGKLIIVKLRTVKNNICIEVKDNGIGIPKDKIGVIFERFGQVDSSLSRQAEGAGIGLSLVKRLVEALDGSISVKSKEGKGSSFTMMLPNEKVIEEFDEDTATDLLDNRLVQTTTVEFSDIYL